MATWTFEPRWKEELLCSCADGKLVLELAMGILTVYLPPIEKWERVVPPWARGRYQELERDLRAWSRAQAIPMVIDESAHVTLPR